MFIDFLGELRNGCFSRLLLEECNCGRPFEVDCSGKEAVIVIAEEVIGGGLGARIGVWYMRVSGEIWVIAESRGDLKVMGFWGCLGRLHCENEGGYGRMGGEMLFSFSSVWE